MVTYAGLLFSRCERFAKMTRVHAMSEITRMPMNAYGIRIWSLGKSFSICGCDGRNIILARSSYNSYRNWMR